MAIRGPATPVSAGPRPARPANQPPRTALILGLDTAAGAYLARLLDARGLRLAGTGGGNLVAGLGIGDKVTRHDRIDAAMLAEVRPDEIYDLRDDATTTAALLRSSGPARVFVASPASDYGTHSASYADARAAVADARAAGRFVVTGTVFPHESRLGPGTSPVARIAAAAYAGTEPDADDLASVTDCGWTPEYVDAMTRMLQQPEPADFAIATGRKLSGIDAARHAAEYFGRDASRFATTDTIPFDAPATPAGTAPTGTAGANRAQAATAIGDSSPAAAALGWRAVTWGRDLVRVLCEGVAAN